MVQFFNSLPYCAWTASHLFLQYIGTEAKLDAILQQLNSNKSRFQILPQWEDWFIKGRVHTDVKRFKELEKVGKHK